MFRAPRGRAGPRPGGRVPGGRWGAASGRRKEGERRQLLPCSLLWPGRLEPPDETAAAAATERLLPSLEVGGGPHGTPTAAAPRLCRCPGPASPAVGLLGRAVKCSRFSETSVPEDSAQMSHLCCSVKSLMSWAPFLGLPQQTTEIYLRGGLEARAPSRQGARRAGVAEPAGLCALQGFRAQSVSPASSPSGGRPQPLARVASLWSPPPWSHYLLLFRVLVSVCLRLVRTLRVPMDNPGSSSHLQFRNSRSLPSEVTVTVQG